jgi:hypothetical protein
MKISDAAIPDPVPDLFLRRQVTPGQPGFVVHTAITTRQARMIHIVRTNPECRRSDTVWIAVS